MQPDSTCQLCREPVRLAIYEDWEILLDTRVDPEGDFFIARYQASLPVLEIATDREPLRYRLHRCLEVAS